MGRWDGQPALLPWLPDLARGKILQALDGQLVHGVNLVVVSWVSESEGQQALLLQVGFWKAESTLSPEWAGPCPLSLCRILTRPESFLF